MDVMLNDAQAEKMRDRKIKVEYEINPWPIAIILALVLWVAIWTAVVVVVR
jgi:hypothetical protein